MKGSESVPTPDIDGLFLGDLSSTLAAAHELKAPLALIRQLSLSLETYDLSPEQHSQLLSQIRLTSERALRLTTDLSRASRLQDSIFECEPLNPLQLCEDVAHELSPLYQAKGREIRAPHRKGNLLVVGNRELLHRILLTFADNALHYSEAKTIVELQATTLNHGQTIRLGVRDYGPAVPPDMWERLQSRLGKSAQALHARPQSSGLGLYVAGQFASVMSGKIGATRHRDGATFYVDLNASTQMRLL
jgi:signal transduction histidine kinase